MEESELLTVREYAKKCGVTTQSIYLRITSGDILPEIKKVSIGMRTVDALYIDTSIYSIIHRGRGRPPGSRNKRKGPPPTELKGLI
jgi:hypothetical protein